MPQYGQKESIQAVIRFLNANKSGDVRKDTPRLTHGPGPLRVWPTNDYAEFSVTWQGSTCPIGDNAMFLLMAMLVDGVDREGIPTKQKKSGRGPWIDHLEIGLQCLGDDLAGPCCVRSLKRRLGQKLRKTGLGELFECVEAGKEKYRLNLCRI